MRSLKHLFDNNQSWVESKKKDDSKIFAKLSEKQTPKYLWLGCSDSRIPAEEILGLNPGEIFVHRNIANLCPHTDFNCLSVLQYGIEYLNIEHVIVCGHYRCRGVEAAMGNEQHGLVDNWLRHIRDVYAREKEELDQIEDQSKRVDRLVELNVIYQVMNICHTTIVQNMWANNKKLTIHGWVYDVYTGLLKDLNCCVSAIEQVDNAYHTLKLH